MLDPVKNDQDLLQKQINEIWMKKNSFLGFFIRFCRLELIQKLHVTLFNIFKKRYFDCIIYCNNLVVNVENILQRNFLLAIYN
jgi:hypothetical protein